MGGRYVRAVIYREQHFFLVIGRAAVKNSLPESCRKYAQAGAPAGSRIVCAKSSLSQLLHTEWGTLPFTRNTSPRQSIASPLTSRVFASKMTCFGRINPSFALLRYYANSPTKQLHGAEFFESYFALSLNSQRNAAELSAELVPLK